VSISGELCAPDCPEARDSLRKATSRPEALAVLLDLTELDFIDASGLRCLIEAAHALKAQDGQELIVVGGGIQVKRVLAATGFDRAMCLVHSLDAAMDMARGSGRSLIERAEGTSPSTGLRFPGRELSRIGPQATAVFGVSTLSTTSPGA
jgi:anti-anti-sigma factor